MKTLSHQTIVLVSATVFAAAVMSVAGCRFVPRRAAVKPMPIETRCVETPANVLVSQYYQQLKPRRIVIATPTSRTHLLPEQRIFALALADSFRQVGFAESVVSPPTSCDTQTIRKGKLDLQQLVDLSHEYSADAVLYCDVVSFSSYAPLQASVSMTLVDARESIAILALDGSWDLREMQTQNAYMNFLASNPAENEFQSGIKYQSPTEFLKFVSMDAAKFMSNQ